MLQALWSASSGMLAQQMSIDAVGNNLANVNTYGYKKSRVDFEDLIYNRVRQPVTVGNNGRQAANVNPVQVGSGVRAAATKMLFEQGNMEQTGNNTDLALSGNAFFEILLPDGRKAYTRDGSFNIDADGYLVASNGYLSNTRNTGGGLLKFPGAEASKLTIDGQGRIFHETPFINLEPYTFSSPKDLEKVEDKIYKPTEDSGEPITLAEAKQQDIDNLPTDEEGNPIYPSEEPKHAVYYQVLLPDGDVGYTTENQFKIDEEGKLVTVDKGYPLEPEVTVDIPNEDQNIKAGAILNANEDGVINHSTEMGKLNIVRFANPAGLERVGSNLYLPTGNSGTAQQADEYNVMQGYVETSNVQVAEEMVNMMLAQRAYELNSRSIKTSDDMLGLANSLLRR